MRKEGAQADLVVARLAGRQHGVVSVGQLVAAGLTPPGITRRVQAGRLHRLHRGVYAVGHLKLSTEARWMAAVLACGDGAVLSHASAANLWGISPTCPSTTHVTVPTTNGRRTRRGVRIHHSSTLMPADTTRRNGIPVTTHARTLRDLGHGDEPTRSQLERAFLRLCRQHGIPKPQVNARVGSYKVDFLWPDAALIVETDGYRYHSGRKAFEEDRRRDRELRRLGFTVLRFTYREVTEDPATVISALEAHLCPPSRTSLTA